MIIVIRKDAGKDKLEKLQNWLKACGVTPHVSVGERQTIVGCIGDVSQIDLPKGKKSGLVEAMEVLRDVEGISVVELTARDVVRHELVQKIVRAYEAYEAKEGDGV